MTPASRSAEVAWDTSGKTGCFSTRLLFQELAVLGVAGDHTLGCAKVVPGRWEGVPERLARLGC